MRKSNCGPDGRQVRGDAPTAQNTYDKIVLTDEQLEAFWEICENPPPPSPQIRKAAKALDKEGFFPH